DRIDAMDAGLVQRMEGIDGRLTAGLTALEESFAERASDAVQEAVERRLGPAVDDMARIAAQIPVNADPLSAAKDPPAPALPRAHGEVVSKAAEALADRIDRTAIRIGDRFDREVETVVDQIGGTMATLATGIQRAPRTRD